MTIGWVSGDVVVTACPRTWCGLRFEVAVKRHLRPETRCRCTPRSSSLLTKRLRSEALCRRLVERVHEDHRLADVEEIEASDGLDETGTEAATLTPSPLEVTQMSAPVRRRSLPRRVPPKGIPRGWFQIGWSSDFTTDKPVSLHYFNCDLVAYRGQGTAESPGQVRVLDAFCRHLAFGGQVEGDCIRGPYHGWLFDGDGANIEVPYGDEGKTGIRLSSWPTAEVDGIVLVWFDPDSQPPSVEPPISFARSPHPSAPLSESARLWPAVRMTPQAAADNVCDAAHFAYIHGSHEMPVLAGNREDGPRFLADYKLVFGGGYESTFVTPNGPTAGTVTTEAMGLGLLWNRTGGVDDVISMLGVTPIDESTSDVRLSVWVPTVRHNGELMPERISKLWVHQQHSQVESDPLIWANQTYIDRPPFLKFEAAPMRAFRSWSAKWYSA
jgi:3-ketosteroid 9alpha-monooxygenase subunit A